MTTEGVFHSEINVYMASLSTERNKRVNGSKITLRMHFYLIFHFFFLSKPATNTITPSVAANLKSLHIIFAFLIITFRMQCILKEWKCKKLIYTVYIYIYIRDAHLHN